MLTIRRASVPAIRAKLTMRCEPSAAVKESDPSVRSDPIAFSAIVDISGIVSSGRPTMLAWSDGAASTVPLLSISTAETPGRPPRLFMIFDIQSRLTVARITASTSSLMAETG
jgi:hypothetical protein